MPWGMDMGELNAAINYVVHTAAVKEMDFLQGDLAEKLHAGHVNVQKI